MSTNDVGMSSPRRPYRLIPEFKPEETVIPLMGWYFAFRINPEATFPTLRTDEISAFRGRGRVYVAYMDHIEGLFDHSQSLHLASVVLLSPERSSNEIRFRTEDMTVAVSPNPDVVMDRQPLQIEPHLPWAHAYHNTVDYGIRDVRIQSRRLGCPNSYKISVEERSRLEMYASDDREKRSAFAPASFNPDPVLPNVEDVEERSVDEDDTASNVSSRDMLDVDAPEDTEEGLPLDGTPDPDSSADTAGLSRGDPLSFQNVTGGPEGDETGDIMNIIQASKEQEEAENPHAPVLEVVTYDLATITEFGTPDQFLEEVAWLEQFIPVHQTRMWDAYQRFRKEFIRAKRHSLPPNHFPWLANVPTRAMSDSDNVAPPDPAEWQVTIERSAQMAEEKASKAATSRQQAEDLLQQAADLRRKVDDLAHEAEICKADAIQFETAAAEARKDKENMETFARFLDVDLKVKDKGTSMVLDRFFTSLPQSDEPFDKEDKGSTVVAREERAAKAEAAPLHSTSSGGSWLARIGEIGLVLTVGVLIGRAWRR